MASNYTDFYSKYMNPDFRQATNKQILGYNKNPMKAGKSILGDTAAGLYPAAQVGLGNINKYAGVRSGMIDKAVNTLSPANNQANIDAYRRGANANALTSGQQAQANYGYGNPALGTAIGLDAQNHATMAGNEYQANMNNPAQMSQQIMQLLQLLSPESISPELQQYTQLGSALAGAPAPPQKSGGLFGNLLGVAAQAAPYIFGGNNSGGKK